MYDDAMLKNNMRSVLSGNQMNIHSRPLKEFDKSYMIIYFGCPINVQWRLLKEIYKRSVISGLGFKWIYGDTLTDKF